MQSFPFKLLYAEHNLYRRLRTADDKNPDPAYLICSLNLLHTLN
jgi:hypothetical protein